MRFEGLDASGLVSDALATSHSMLNPLLPSVFEFCDLIELFKSSYEDKKNRGRYFSDFKVG